MDHLNQTYLNYAGRLIYNHRRYYTQNNSEFLRNKNGVMCVRTTGNKPLHLANSEEPYSIFRDDHAVFHGSASKSFSYTGLNIVDCIIAKRHVNQSILHEITVLGNNICLSTYTNSFTINNVTSNIENHYFSRNGAHIAHIGSLGSYAQMDFTCFDLINNQNLKNFLTNRGNLGWIDDNISLHLSQIISIFLCETSRNPSAFLTIPMCLELTETIDNSSADQRRLTIDQIHKASPNYQDLLNKKNQAIQYNNQGDLNRINNEIESKFIDINEDMTQILRSEIVKDVILSLFPLSMTGAVAASREISTHINTTLQQNNKLDQLAHRYDDRDGSLTNMRQFLRLEDSLIQQYQMHILRQNDQSVHYQHLAKDWFNIDIVYQDNVVNIMGNTFDTLFTL